MDSTSSVSLFVIIPSAIKTQLVLPRNVPSGSVATFSAHGHRFAYSDLPAWYQVMSDGTTNMLSDGNKYPVPPTAN